MPNPTCYVDGRTIRGRVFVTWNDHDDTLHTVCLQHRYSPLPVSVNEPLLSQKGIETLMEKEAERDRRGLRGFKRPSWAYE
jgi:hypothetical protein